MKQIRTLTNFCCYYYHCERQTDGGADDGDREPLACLPPPLSQVWTERRGHPGGEGGVHRQGRQELPWMSHRQMGECLAANPEAEWPESCCPLQAGEGGEKGREGSRQPIATAPGCFALFNL